MEIIDILISPETVASGSNQAKPLLHTRWSWEGVTFFTLPDIPHWDLSFPRTSSTCGIIRTFPQKTKEKIAYHNGQVLPTKPSGSGAR